MNRVLQVLAVAAVVVAAAAQIEDDDVFGTLAARVDEARNLAIGPTTSDVIAQLIQDCGKEVVDCALDAECSQCAKDFNPDAFNFDPQYLVTLDFDGALAQLQAAFPKSCTDLIVNHDTQTGALVQCSLHSALNKALNTVKDTIAGLIPDIPDIPIPDIPDIPLPDIPDIPIPDIPDINWP
ncbi:hypothetical protein JKP88DRAFT_217886 [Tribonema minus]|uniref:Uncharacterized protein n=1 Tax=Tribonema minus TaxID=303371 RepID=A0A835ZHJ4_9STRA|nr:hypothetical protein JKP88DRAFT_217886 [Tribonema minus]